MRVSDGLFIWGGKVCLPLTHLVRGQLRLGRHASSPRWISPAPMAHGPDARTQLPRSPAEIPVIGHDDPALCFAAWQQTQDGLVRTRRPRVPDGDRAEDLDLGTSGRSGSVEDHDQLHRFVSNRFERESTNLFSIPLAIGKCVEQVVAVDDNWHRKRD